MRTLMLTVALLPALLPCQSPANRPATMDRPGKHFRIRLHPGDLPPKLAGELADEARRVVEGFWPTLAKMAPAAHAPAAQTIHLYAREDDYRRAEKADSPFPCKVEVFTAKDLSAHVVIWPQLPTQTLEVIGLPYDTRQALLRVAAEQFFLPLSPKGDDDGWCRWILVMGAIEAATNPEHRAGRDTGHDDRRFVAISRRVQSIDMSLALCVDPGIDYSESWQIRWAQTIGALLAQSLAAANRDWARQLPTRLAGSKKRDRSAQRRDALLGILGTDWAGANRAYEAMCDTFDVMWHVAEPCVDIGPKRTLLAASRLPASLRATQEERAGPYAIHGRAELGPGASDPLLVRFGWDGKTFVGVGFREGQVLIAVWRASDRRYHFERRVDAPIEAGKPFDFRVEVTATEVRAFVGGALSCAWPHAGHSVQHMQSVNLTNRIAWLENLVIEDLPASGK